MPAEVEEVVEGSHPADSQDVGPDAGQELLGVGDRRGVGPGPGLLRVGFGQGCSIELAVGGEGELSELDEDRGNHVLGQA